MLKWSVKVPVPLYTDVMKQLRVGTFFEVRHKHVYFCCNEMLSGSLQGLITVHIHFDDWLLDLTFPTAGGADQCLSEILLHNAESL